MIVVVVGGFMEDHTMYCPGMRRLLAVLLALTLLTAACGDDSGGSSDGDSGTGAASDDTAGGGAGTDSTWLTDLLARVPDSETTRRQVIANDFDLAAEGAGIDRPDDGASEEEVARSRILLMNEVPGPQTFPTASTGAMSSPYPQASREEVGFTFEDISRDLFAGEAPEQIEVLQGGIDAETVEAAVTSDPTWSDELDRAEANGTEYYTWLDDGEVRLELRSPLRQIGNSLRLAVVDDTALVTRTTALMEAALGDGATLGDDPVFTAVATTLQDEGAHSVFLTDAPPTASASRLEGIPTDVPAEAAEELLAGAEGFDPARVIGTGTGYRDGKQTFIEVIAYDDDGTAQVNADRLETLVNEGESLVNRQRWADALDIDSIEVQDGLIVAVFTTERPQLWLETIFSADNIASFG